MAGETLAVERARFSASDPVEALEFMGLLYGCDLKVADIEERPWRMRFDQVQVGPVVAVNLDMPADLRFQLIGRDEFVVTTMVGGTADIERRDGRECFGPGEVYLAIDPRADDPCRCDHAHAYTVTLSRSLLDDVVSGTPGTAPPTWAFRSHRPIAGAGRRWVGGLRLFRDLVDSPGSQASPLVLGPATRLLAALALAAFPNTAMIADDEPPGRDRRDAHPDTLRHAIAFIEANPQRDITLADIARAAWVTPRAIQVTFRRHLDTTPMAYLRRVRLQCAHDELRGASRSTATVAEVAGRWGFSNPSRFARYYASVYGESPSATLAR